MLIVDASLFYLCYRDEGFMKHSLSGLLPVSTLSSAMSAGYTFGQVEMLAGKLAEAACKVQLDVMASISKLLRKLQGGGRRAREG
jgi:hypothetical protein